MNSRSESTRAALGAAVLAMVLGLSACGDGGSSSTASNNTPQQGTTAPPAAVPPTTQPTPSPAPAPTPAPAPATVGTAALQWSAPLTNTDGSSLQDLAGYIVVYGDSANDLDQTIRINNPSIDRYVVEQLPAGTYYFAVKAFNSRGLESERSNVVSKVVG
jgi:hypothetical protein